MHKAIRLDEPVTLTDLQVKRNGSYVPVKVTIKPLQEPNALKGLFLVSFEERPEVKESASEEGSRGEEFSSSRQLPLCQ